MTTTLGRQRARELGNLIPLLGAQLAAVEALENDTEVTLARDTTVMKIKMLRDADTHTGPDWLVMRRLYIDGQSDGHYVLARRLTATEARELLDQAVTTAETWGLTRI